MDGEPQDREEEPLAGVQNVPSRHTWTVFVGQTCRDGQKYAGRADLLLFIIQASEHMGRKGDEEEEARRTAWKPDQDRGGAAGSVSGYFHCDRGFKYHITTIFGGGGGGVTSQSVAASHSLCHQVFEKLS